MNPVAQLSRLISRVYALVLTLLPLIAPPPPPPPRICGDYYRRYRKPTFTRRPILITVLFAALLIAAALPRPSLAQGGTCITMIDNDQYIRANINTNNYIPPGPLTTYTNLLCNTVHSSSPFIVPQAGWTISFSHFQDLIALLEACTTHVPRTISVARYRIILNNTSWTEAIWLCQAPAPPSARQSRPRSKPFVPRRIPATGEVLNQTELEIRAFDGFYSGIQFQRIYAEHVGYKSVNELGFLDGVDAWSNIGKGYEVCFPQAGVILFADAANAPRVLEEIDYYSRDHYTCASEARAGTMFLVETNPSP